MMTPAMREDLAGREQDIQRGKTVELLRRAGKEMYDNPIVNTAIGFTPVLGDVQAAGETMAAFNRGAPWQETAGYAAGMLPFVPMIGKTVWHGSPHTFDKFDLSKIGTGEGAQAYGHGLYLADEKPTALKYAKGDAPITFTLKQTGEEITPNHPMYEDLSGTYERMAKNGYIDDFLEQVEPKNSSLYKVDLPDEQIAKMLDWDKPLSEQPEVVRNVLGDLSSSTAAQINEKRMLLNQQNPERLTHPVIGKLANKETLPNEIIGNKLYEQLSQQLGGAENVSKWLHEQGIPGIQYLDQASRGAGDGTRNYVVFSDEIPQILERNGTPLGNAVRNFETPKSVIANIPLSAIEHGESAMPGGKLSFPESRGLIKQYAEMPTDIPPIQAMAPDEAGGKWMIYDGSHRYEAAKLRGMNEIPVELDNIDDIEAARQAGYLK